MVFRMDFLGLRTEMVSRYLRLGYIKNPRVKEAMLRVKREDFMTDNLIEYAYHDEPFPIPGDGRQTISAPYTYPLFYEPLELAVGDRFLEIGMGSGYGAALARELVGEEGVVVSVEVNRETYTFGRRNLEKGGYTDVITVCGDGSKGYPEMAPYEKICITAACPDIPPPLIHQLQKPGRLVAPVGPISRFMGQDLILLTKDREGQRRQVISKVVYVPLIGEHGWKTSE